MVSLGGLSQAQDTVVTIGNMNGLRACLARSGGSLVTERGRGLHRADGYLLRAADPDLSVRAWVTSRFDRHRPVPCPGGEGEMTQSHDVTFDPGTLRSLSVAHVRRHADAVPTRSEWPAPLSPRCAALHRASRALPFPICLNVCARAVSASPLRGRILLIDARTRQGGGDETCITVNDARSARRASRVGRNDACVSQRG